VRTEQYPVIGGEDLDAIVNTAVRELRRLARQEQVRLGEKEMELLTQGVLRQVLGCDHGPPTLMLPKPIAPLQRELGPGPAEATSEVVDS
jgi:hypothetical protein